MRDSIHPAHSTHAHGQRHGQIHIVNHRAGQNLGITPRLLHAVRRLAQNGRHLAARVRRGDTNVRQTRPNADRLAQANGTPATDRDDAVRALGVGVGEGLLGDVGRGVHGCLGEDARDGDIAVVVVAAAAVFEDDLVEVVGLGDLFGGGEEEWFGEGLAGQFGGEFGDGATAEDHPAWVGVVLELVHVDECSVV